MSEEKKKGLTLRFNLDDELPGNHAAHDAHAALMDERYHNSVVPLTMARLANAIEIRRLRETLVALTREIKKGNRNG